MSTPKPAVSSTALVVGVVVVFCFTVAAVVVVAVAVPDGGNAGSLVALLLGSMATTIPAIAALAKISNVQEQVTDLNNGRMDSKIRAAVADVIGPNQVHPPARAQVANDRARRDTEA